MSTEDITKKNKGIGVENFHYLNDGLWNMKKSKLSVSISYLQKKKTCQIVDIRKNKAKQKFVLVPVTSHISSNIPKLYNVHMHSAKKKQ